jgi:UDP:flavonoid glycosyltransferase YjiC (YdhE family)
MRTDTLFVTFEAGGNVPPMLAVAQRLVAGAGTALVLGSPSQRSAVEAAGLPFEPFSHEQAYGSLRPMTARQNLSGITRTMADPVLAADAVRVARQAGARTVLVDCMLVGVIDALARDGGARVVTLVHSLPSYWVRGYARGPVGMVSTLRGLRPGRVWRSAAGSLATVLPGFDRGATTAFADLHEIGPIHPAVHPAVQHAGAPPVSAPGPRTAPRVLISLSTMWFPGQDRTLQALLDAVAGLDVEAVVTTGPTIDPASLRAPANVELLSTADHDALLAWADLLVGHGGHGTTMRALAHDVPVLVLPSFAFADQPLVGRRVQQLGAGRTLPPKTPLPRLRAAIAELAGPGPHRGAAAGLGARLRALDPGRSAVEYLIAGSSSRPSTPPGSPAPPTTC